MRVDDEPRGWPPGFGEGVARERDALLVLSSLQGITPRRLRRVAWAEGSADACLAAIRDGRAGSRLDREYAERTDPAAMAAALDDCGATVLTYGGPGYPRELEDLQHDPPAWLFVRGRPFEPQEQRIAIVGSRSCSALGREVAHDLGRRLAGAGVHVVSGAAHGIDEASHRGALAAPGRTVAVLGAGIDVAYPRSNAALLDRILATGTIVSEYPPGVPAVPRNFPARNRIVAGLAKALVVVEGAGKSGSRISVDHALDLGRDVFAVPGPVTSPLAEVPLALIREGATMIRGADDLLDDLGITWSPHAPPAELPAQERLVFEALTTPVPADVLAHEAGLTLSDTLTALLGLELRGLVRGAGGRFERTLRPSEGG
ncbi:MAG: DNA-processing protein DprA [Actinomycetota bacterium]